MIASEATMDTDKPPIPSADWLKWLGERRDGFLVGGAVLYGLGYLVWSYNAWRNHLGQLPALEFQYAMSGLIPGAVIGIAWASTAFFSSIQAKVGALFNKYQVLALTLTGAIALSDVLLSLATDRGWLNL